MMDKYAKWGLLSEFMQPDMLEKLEQMRLARSRTLGREVTPGEIQYEFMRFYFDHHPEMEEYVLSRLNEKPVEDSVKERSANWEFRKFFNRNRAK